MSTEDTDLAHIARQLRLIWGNFARLGMTPHSGRTVAQALSSALPPGHGDLRGDIRIAAKPISA